MKVAFSINNHRGAGPTEQDQPFFFGGENMKQIAITIGSDNGNIIARADKDSEKSGLIRHMDFVRIGQMVGRIIQITDFHDFTTDNEISIRAKEYLQKQSAPDQEVANMLYKRLNIEPMGEVYPDGEIAEYMGGIGYFEPVFPANESDINKLFPLQRGLHIGQITNGIQESNVPFYLSRETLSRHFAVFGKNGSGKTNFLKELIAANIEQDNPLPMLVFGHPDIGMDNPNDNGTRGIMAMNRARVTAIGYKQKILLSPQEIALSDIFDQFEMSTAMRDLWHYVQSKEPQDFIRKLARYDLNADPLKLIRKVIRDPKTKQSTTTGISTIPTIDAVCKQARILNNYIDTKATPIIAHILAELKRGKTVLVNTFNMSEYYQGLFVKLLLSRLQKAGKHALHRGIPQQFFVIIDEAQHFIKRAGESIGEFIMECRKFGVTLLLSTQSPKSIPEAVYGQIYSTLSFHMNKADIKTLVDNAPALDDYKAIIRRPPLKKTLGIGIIQAAGYPYPAVIKIPRFERRFSKEVQP